MSSYVQNSRRFRLKAEREQAEPKKDAKAVGKSYDEFMHDAVVKSAKPGTKVEGKEVSGR